MNLRHPYRIWGWIATVGGLSALAWLMLAAAPAPSVADILPWTWVVALVVVAEFLQLHFEFRGQAAAMNFRGATLVLGLAVLSPGHFALCAALSAAAVALKLRRSVVKAAFAIVCGLLEFAVTGLAYVGVRGSASGNSPHAWLATAAALAAGVLVSSLAVHVVMSLANGRWESLRQVMFLGVFVTVGNLLLGLLALQVVWTDWRAGWMVVAMSAGLWLGYRAFIKLRQRYGSLNLLHTFSHALTGLTDGDEVSATALKTSKELLRAEQSALVFALSDGAAVRRIDESGTLETVVYRSGHTPPITELLRRSEPTLVTADSESPADRALCEQLGVRDLVAAPFLADGIRGVFVVGGRLSDMSTFDGEDSKLLETFAQHTAVSLTVGELVDQLRREVIDREFQAMHDALTGLPNRTRLEEEIAELTTSATAQDKAVVMLMDLDDFKDVNDTLGHSTGDALLAEIGRRLSAAVGSRGTVARLGGDEFAVALCCMHDDKEILTFVDEIRRSVEEPYVVDRLSLAVRFSIGVALSPDHGEDPKVLLQRADIAMYAAKDHHAGVTIYADTLDKSSTRRLALAGELGPALANREFQLFYQPQLDISTGEVIALEALARWPHPEYKSVPPDEFIPLVEQSGLIATFTDWALETALRDLNLWRELWPQLRMSVNMSARNLQDPTFPQTVQRHLDQAGLPGGALTLELTEGTVMSDPDRALFALAELHALGVQIAIDDFGTGYSSLSYLKRLPVDEVKIDKSFVMTMVGDDDDVAIVRSTIDLARSLGMVTVAEGVENAESVAILGSLGCDAAQGYFLSRPLPSADIEQKIRALHRSYRQVGTGSAEEMRQAVIRHFSGLGS